MSREVLEGLQVQSPDEEVVREISVTPPAVSVLDLTVTDMLTGQDVTAAVMPGTASVVGGAIRLPVLKGLTYGHTYQVEALYSDGNGSKLEPLIRVQCI
jgi:hypothetical protein